MTIDPNVLHILETVIGFIIAGLVSAIGWMLRGWATKIMKDNEEFKKCCSNLKQRMVRAETTLGLPEDIEDFTK